MGNAIQPMNWNAVVGNDNDWRAILRSNADFNWTPAQGIPRLLQHNSATFQQYFRMNTLTTNPATKIISSGVRHVSKSRDFLSQCPTWAHFPGRVEDPLPRLRPNFAPFLNPASSSAVSSAAAASPPPASGTHMVDDDDEVQITGAKIKPDEHEHKGPKHTEAAWSDDDGEEYHPNGSDDEYDEEEFREIGLVKEDHPSWTVDPAAWALGLPIFSDDDWEQLHAHIKRGKFWLKPHDKKEVHELEHFFECRFAGQLIKALTNGFSQTDGTTQDALVLLDRIINHNNNLTWTPQSLNAAKKLYFDGHPFHPENADIVGVFAYMTTMSGHFKGMIDKAAQCLAGYQNTDMIARMLKVLYMSPFCTGKWKELTNAKGEYQWTT